MRAFAFFFALALLITGCGNSSSSGDATAKLRFAKSARFFAMSPVRFDLTRALHPASTFKMKLIAAYLTEDIAAGTGNNVGQTTMFYLNPECADDIMHCDVTAGTAEDNTPFTGVISTFFDFSDSTTANTALNSQGLSIQSGSYKYARLEFCKYATGTDPNIKWASDAAGVTSEQSFKQTSCTVNSAEFTPPLEIASGGSATVTLTYDISTAVTTTGSGGANCDAAGAGTNCFTLPTFIPSASTP